LARTDLYFLLRYLLNRPDVEHPWLYDRIREVEASPNGHLDLWARGHYKSTIITFALTIQDILASYGDEPLAHWRGHEPTFCIFSHTRPIAKAFLRQIKHELAYNDWLKELFPDILYANPDVQSPKWSEDQGLVVIRHSNPKEATVEAWGLVDGQPTSKHFNVLIWDDTVTQASVTNPEMIAKTTNAWELSLNLGSDTASNETIKRYIGTRYHWADTYHTLIARQAAKPRIYPGTADGSLTGKPIFLSQKQWDDKVQEMGPYTAACQLLQNPTKDTSQGFSRDWIRRHDGVKNWMGMNRYILVDPANAKKKTSDYTAVAVVGLGPDGNKYLLDGYRDRLNLKERTELVMDLHKKWSKSNNRPYVHYEKYGKDSDIEHIQLVQAEENYRFDIVALPRPKQPNLAKNDRIKRLIPDFANGTWYLPRDLWRTLHDGKVVDLMLAIIEEELLAFPVPLHDDFLDAMSRIYDCQLVWPKISAIKHRDRYADDRRPGSFMSA
jgi:predicted phage terminase large subunit-like protein